MVLQSNPNLGRLLFLVFLPLCLSCTIFAQLSSLPSEAVDTGLGGTNAIVGTVLRPSGQRMGTQIKIRLMTMTRGDRITMTDEYGSFSFRSLPPGNYTIVIDKENEYEPLTYPLDIFQSRTPQVYNINLRLTLKGIPRIKPGVVDSELANVPKPALNFYDKAKELSRKGDYKAAIEQLQLAIAEYPNFMLAFNELGVQYLRLNKLEKADESFRSALKINPDAFPPMMNRGIVLVQLKKFDEAEKVIRSSLKIKEDSPVAHYFLGQALANLGRFDEAENELLLAIKSGGEQMKEAHRFLAIIYSAKGNKKRAANELETYLRLFPKTPDAEQLRKAIEQLKNSSATVDSTKSPK
jgi:Flp pilus assembly protein TadD